MSEIFVIGVDARGLNEQQRQILDNCRLIVASGRLAPHAGPTDTKVIPITPLKEAFAAIEKALENGDVGVLASGDPLLFGVGSTIIERFGGECVRVLPALSSMQEAFARFKMTWTDAVIISLHGRKESNIPGLLLCQQKSFLFTDKTHPPNVIADTLLDYLHLIGDTHITENTTIHVAEQLGSEGERIVTGTLAEISAKQFDDLNVVCLTLPKLPPRPVFGLQEHDIAHSRGLITKDEVRAATLHRLRLPRKGVFWDIGGGSGSVSLEAAAFHPELTVYTVEHKEEELDNIKENIRRFSLFNVIPVGKKAPEGLDNLPDPDVVFIGGSGGNLEAIVGETVPRLGKGSRLVVNGVTEKTITEAPKYMQQCGLSVETSTIEVSRTGPSGPLRFNPITIMVGRT